jgi:hypothetical protein
MKPQGLIDVEHDRVRDDAQPVTHPLDGDRANLFSLRLGVAIEPRGGGWKQDLERVVLLRLSIGLLLRSHCVQSPPNRSSRACGY